MSDYQSMRKKRAETDYIMPMWLPFLPIIISIVGGILAAALAVGIGLITSAQTAASLSSNSNGILLLAPILIMVFAIGAVSAALMGYVMYRLIKRFNDHALRMKALFGSVNGDGRENQVISEIDSLPRRDPAEWAIIIAIFSIIPFLSIVAGILTLYIFHSLNKDYVKIERAENNGFMQIGWKGDRYFKMIDRSTALYIVLTIITLGIFMLYWIYTVAKDPNEHFREDWRIEDSITPS
ncbi:MAG: DUF4234 domain-containing protein [Nitrososphaerota archaeon]|nr:DUF4234 domain-containing protein [Nitrososphaerota archaeon]MDG6927372.1 DUF4234 domain-containing protein [Nitrososphaerota archaeon]MDG6931069.1 DUF4234 domain-containing protein [Nitrososphaerota archaeon]MDG6932200.1 DUF4234 domain-containing protein [Nitrososphaerota archaeon]MDG6935267.1 DUF4234 domain-containing protein [Nitrososphaerota archaeon]